MVFCSKITKQLTMAKCQLAEMAVVQDDAFNQHTSSTQESDALFNEHTRFLRRSRAWWPNKFVNVRKSINEYTDPGIHPTHAITK